MKRSAWWLSAVALVLAGGFVAGGCSTKQVRQESGVTPAPGAAEARPESTAPREQNLSSSGESAPRVAESSLPPAGAPEAPPKAIASQVEARGPDVTKPVPTPLPGTAESAPGLKRIHFDFDRSAITPESKAILEKNAKFLLANPGLRIQIQGHCDERGTTEYNIALGERRAKAAFQYLMDLGVDPNRMSTTSFGKESPLDPGHNEAAWAKNRRAEFVKAP